MMESAVVETAVESKPSRAVEAVEMSAGCGMSGLLEVLTRPWTLHVLWTLSTRGPMRFGAMRRSIGGISARLLTLRLRTLEEKGFIRRTVKNTNPPQVTYSPTARLQEMNGVMEHLHRLSDKWQQEDQSEGIGIREEASETSRDRQAVA
jgi:DNA-binding HxlR family transcriptional regulator